MKKLLLIFSIALLCECAYCQDAVKHEPRYKPTVHAPAMDTVSQQVIFTPWQINELRKLYKEITPLEDKLMPLYRLRKAILMGAVTSQNIDTLAIVGQRDVPGGVEYRVKKLRENALEANKVNKPKP